MLLDTIIDLQDRGFTLEFSLLGSRLFCSRTRSFFSSDHFDVLEIHSFDDNDSNDETVIYAIECVCDNTKGILFESNRNLNLLNSKLKKFWR